MRIFIKGVFIFFGAMLLQWWWNTHFSYWGAAPQFLLVLTAIIAVRGNPVIAMLAGFGWGLYMDVARAELFGASALLMTIISYATSVVRRQVDLGDAIPLAGMVFLLSILHLLGHGVVALIFTKSFEWCGWVAFIATPFLNALTAMIVMLAVENWSRR